MGQFAAGSGKKAGEFYTPQRTSDILSAIVTLDSQAPNSGPRRRLARVMDFACGSGSLLLNVRKRMGPHGIGRIVGQEKNITTCNLARMNMLLHGVQDTEFEIFHGDTLTNDWDMLRETNPPFSYRWDPTEALGEDVRFRNCGLAPKSAADFAFLLHGFSHLRDDGVMAIILPHGVLFRGGAEARIRRKLLDDGHIDTVIGLPANLFYSTGIPVCIVLFVNASGHFEKGKRQNALSDAHVGKSVERYARRVAMDEIAANDFNLNIARYVSTAAPEEEIDLAETHGELVEIETQLQASATKHNAFLEEPGLPSLPAEER
ncbi:MAG: N-6 DNA methylase [Rhodospirillaceae bacterium]|nr:N-6 DNA methylase [Rhodospirillaceae bacterium]